MPFNEQNTVENFIIHRLTGVNLNRPAAARVEEPAAPNYATARWQYLPADQLARDTTEVLVEPELRQALVRLNPEIAAEPSRAEEVLHRLRAILLSVGQVGLVRANEEFARWLRGEMSMPFGKNGEHSTVRLLDFERPANNTWVCSNQFKIRARETKIPDLVLLVNGIPLVVGEAKTAVRPSVSWLDGAMDIHDIYENTVPALFVPTVFNFASDGKDFRYGGVRTPLEFWSPWRLDESHDELSKWAAGNLQDVGEQVSSLLRPAVLLDFLQHFTLFATNSKKRKIKIVARYQQFEGANLLVERVVEGRVKKGLIWHFQGSGKSLLMVFAAQKLRRSAALKSPTVIIVVDRIDLDSQISGTFSAADVPNLVNADSVRELHDLLERDTRKIIIAMVHKFKDATPDMNLRENIIVMVDEAHRTQEGDLGRKMRAALPNAFLFGLTGTPINRSDKNTFWAFGAAEDAGGYLSRYTFQDSIRDGQTLPLHFEPRLPNIHIDKEKLDTAFDELANDLSETERNLLSQKAAQMSVFLKSPERIQTIVADIARHFRQHVEPQGFKAMIVAPDREACTFYKLEMDAHFPASASAVVISGAANDGFEFKEKWSIDRDKQEKIVETFNEPHSELKFLIVTAKLLTGFDAPILQTMYLDKSLKDHTLLQAICRTNRLFPNKTFGRIVDYFGLFDDTARALAFDEISVKKVITNLQELRDLLPDLLAKTMAHFAEMDKNLEGFEGLQRAQECLRSDAERDAFALDYSNLSKIWESLSPDAALNSFQKDYRWLSQIYESLRPSSDDTGRLLWHALGAQTTALIHSHIHVDGIADELEEMILDAEVIDELMQKHDSKDAEKLLRILISRFRRPDAPPIFQALSERLDAVRLRAEQGLISSIEFIKELCQIARETLIAERENFTPAERKSAKAALTELFLETRTDKTPAVVERIVNDIDSIVKVVRFPGWQSSVAGEREVQKALRQKLMKYQLHREEELFQRAYGYIREYY